MTTTKAKPIKAVKGFRGMTAEVVLSTSTNVFTGIFNNSNFTAPQAPAPPVDSATLKSANDVLAAGNAAALDGGKKALAQKAHAKETVVKLLEQLAMYVQANCKDDMTIFLSSGFTAVSSSKTATPPASDSIRKVEPGEVSGQMRITLMKYPGGISYEVRWAPAVPAGNPSTWTSQPVGLLRPATTISGLTPGTNYVFQVRAVTKTGYSDWSDSVTRVVV
jgi:hypothetical protein